LLAIIVSALAAARPAAADIQAAPTQGTMMIARDGGPPEELPLLRTKVHIQISGVAAQVEVAQSFHNPYTSPIEAVYVFPLPDDAAVGAMTIHVGDRTIRGVIKTRDEARATYAAAREAGKTAALLEQERPNIFTQSVTNIGPGQEIEVALVYDVLVHQDAGTYEVAYPMTVGPRYIPGNPLPPPDSGGGRLPDTDRVPDASRITPPVRPPGTRSGQDIEIAIALDAGLPIEDLASPTHAVAVEQPSPDHAVVRLAAGATIPNKDLVLRWRLAGDATRATVLSHHVADGGYLSLVLLPPAATERDQTGVELVFVVDTSGSMQGEPLDLVKQAMRYALGRLRPADSFRIINFSDEVGGMPAPLPVTPANVRAGLQLIDELGAGGGTEMLSGIEAALSG
jgi:Ca-activated chloride channel family protein